MLSQARSAAGNYLKLFLFIFSLALPVRNSIIKSMLSFAKQ